MPTSPKTRATLITGVYQILNVKNGKVYVGGAYESFSDRWSRHKTALNKGIHFNPHLQAAWNKYGEAWFIFEVIERCVKNKKHIAERETYWNAALDATNPDKGYNICPTGGSTLGIKHSAEAKTKMSTAKKGNKYCLGRNYSAETKAKMSVAKKGNKIRLGHKHSAETKAKMSLTNKIRYAKLQASK